MNLPPHCPPFSRCLYGGCILPGHPALMMCECACGMFLCVMCVSAQPLCGMCMCIQYVWSLCVCALWCFCICVYAWQVRMVCMCSVCGVLCFQQLWGQNLPKTQFWPLLGPLASLSPKLFPARPPRLVPPHPQECSSFCFQPQTKIRFHRPFMSLEQCLSWSPALPPFLKALNPWAGCQNFTLICCSLEPESLNLIKGKVRKCAVYLIIIISSEQLLVHTQSFNPNTRPFRWGSPRQETCFRASARPGMGSDLPGFHLGLIIPPPP